MPYSISFMSQPVDANSLRSRSYVALLELIGSEFISCTIFGLLSCATEMAGNTAKIRNMINLNFSIFANALFRNDYSCEISSTSISKLLVIKDGVALNGLKVTMRNDNAKPINAQMPNDSKTAIRIEREITDVIFAI